MFKIFLLAVCFALCHSHQPREFVMLSHVSETTTTKGDLYQIYITSDMDVRGFCSLNEYAFDILESFADDPTNETYETFCYGRCGTLCPVDEEYLFLSMGSPNFNMHHGRAVLEFGQVYGRILMNASLKLDIRIPCYIATNRLLMNKKEEPFLRYSNATMLMNRPISMIYHTLRIMPFTEYVIYQEACRGENISVNHLIRFSPTLYLSVTTDNRPILVHINCVPMKEKYVIKTQNGITKTQIIEYIRDRLPRRPDVVFHPYIMTSMLIMVNSDRKASVTRIGFHFRMIDSTKMMTDDEKWDTQQLSEADTLFKLALKKRDCEINRCPKRQGYVDQNDMELSHPEAINNFDIVDLDDINK